MKNYFYRFRKKNVTMERDAEKCFICDKMLDRQEPSKIITCKQVAMERLIRSSLRRKDKKYVFLKNRDSVDLHRSCYMNYINEGRITAAKDRLLLSLGSGKAEGKANDSCPRKSVPQTKPTPISCRKIAEPVAELENFDFMKHCFYCGKRADDEYIRKNAKHGTKSKSVQWVKKEQTKTNILERIAKEKKSDGDYMEAIEDKIKNVDLVAVGARYHHNCMVGFYNYSSASSHVIGRPLSQTTIDIINFIKKYIDENTEERQHSLKNLIAKYQNVHENEDEPSVRVRNLKDKLLQFFGDKISIHKIRGDYILTSVDFVDDVLSSNS